MTFLQLAPSAYAQNLTEAAATTVISCENIHQDSGESATDALVWAIENGGLFTFEHALTLLVDQAVQIHEDQRADSVTTSPLSLFGVGTAKPDRGRPEPAVIGNWLPEGADEEDRILSLLALDQF